MCSLTWNGSGKRTKERNSSSATALKISLVWHYRWIYDIDGTNIETLYVVAQPGSRMLQRHEIYKFNSYARQVLVETSDVELSTGLAILKINLLLSSRPVPLAQTWRYATKAANSLSPFASLPGTRNSLRHKPLGDVRN